MERGEDMSSMNFFVRVKENVFGSLTTKTFPTSKLAVFLFSEVICPES